MKNILLNRTLLNVCIFDKKTGDVLYKGHNLFVDSGRKLIADIFTGAVTFDPINFVCDLGSDATNVLPSQLDLLNYTSPLSFIATNPYPISLSGYASGVDFLFEFNNTGFGGDKTIRELGLFYRADSDDFPRRGSDPPTMTGVMLARLKTNGAITVSDTNTITIEWEIIF